MINSDSESRLATALGSMLDPADVPITLIGIAEPERPAIMIEVSSTPSSRSTRMPIRSTVNGDALKRASWKMPCWATIAPTRKLISRMIGALRSAKISRW